MAPVTRAVASRQNLRIDAQVQPPPAPPAPVRRTKTKLQTGKDEHAGRVSKEWPHKNRKSRGIKRHANECYRISAIQSLLHLPKFMNWISSHNVRSQDANGGTQNPCSQANRKHCVACQMKDLIAEYWSNQGVVNSRSFPAPLDEHSCAPLRRLGRIANGWFRGGNQEDAEEYQTRLLRGCLESVRPRNPIMTEWAAQYCGLFTIRIQAETFCPHCGAQRWSPGVNDTHRPGQQAIGFDSIAVDEDQLDSVQAAIRRHMAPSLYGDGTDYECEVQACKRRSILTTHRYIEAAPEYLRVRLNLFTSESICDDDGTVLEVQYVKSTLPHTISPTLNLTDIQRNPSTPLRYRLIGVIPHNGGLDNGHWIATVQGSDKKIYSINDNVVQTKQDKFLHSNPQIHSRHPFQAVILMYVRQQPRANPRQRRI